MFVYQLFFSSNISDFSLFFTLKLQPSLKKVTSLFPNNPPLKIMVLSSSPTFKIWWEVQSPNRKEEGAHYDGHNKVVLKNLEKALMSVINLMYLNYAL